MVCGLNSKFIQNTAFPLKSPSDEFLSNILGKIYYFYCSGFMRRVLGQKKTTWGRGFKGYHSVSYRPS